MDNSSLPSLPAPRAVVMCRPDFFAIEEAQNPFMEADGQLHVVDAEAATRQWEALVDVLLGLEMDVELLEPTEGLPDQVFTANPVFAFPDPQGRPHHLESVMRHDSREPEVEALSGALRALGSRAVSNEVMLEGGGDLLWHHRRRHVWMGHGFRTDPLALGAVRMALAARVTPLRLVDPRYYHLDTCLCIVDDEAALWVPGAFDDQGRQEIESAFKLLIDVSDEGHLMAANAFSVDGEHVVIDGACTKTVAALAEHGYVPVPVDTSEFRKAGGSVYCMKQLVW